MVDTGEEDRHCLPSRFEELRWQALVSAAPITLVLFDLDHFKRLNDHHGHDVADRLLREVADEAEGEALAEGLRVTIDQLGERTGSGLTASFGVSGGSGEDIDFDRLYREADQALYRAKRAGRDRVRTGHPVRSVEGPSVPA